MRSLRDFARWNIFTLIRIGTKFLSAQQFTQQHSLPFSCLAINQLKWTGRTFYAKPSRLCDFARWNIFTQIRIEAKFLSVQQFTQQHSLPFSCLAINQLKWTGQTFYAKPSRLCDFARWNIFTQIRIGAKFLSVQQFNQQHSLPFSCLAINQLKWTGRTFYAKPSRLCANKFF
jgi:hypothetical protein